MHTGRRLPQRCFAVAAKAPPVHRFADFRLPFAGGDVQASDESARRRPWRRSLALIAAERLLERVAGLFSAASGRKHFAEVGERIALRVQRACSLGDCDRLARKPFRLRVLASLCVHSRPHLPPEHPRGDVVFVTELAPELRERLGFLESAHRAEVATPSADIARTCAHSTALRTSASSPLSLRLVPFSITDPGAVLGDRRQMLLAPAGPASQRSPPARSETTAAGGRISSPPRSLISIPLGLPTEHSPLTSSRRKNLGVRFPLEPPASLDSPWPTRAGTGLGLAIAKAYTQAHGGDLIYDPADRGARFELILPMAI
jgi:hypothetical protein